MPSGHRDFVVQPDRAAALGRQRQRHTTELAFRRWGHVAQQFTVDVGGRQATTEASAQRHIGAQLKALNFGFGGVGDSANETRPRQHSRFQLQVRVVVIEGRGVQRQGPAHQGAAHADLGRHNAFGLKLLEPGGTIVEATALEALGHAGICHEPLRGRPLQLRLRCERREADVGNGVRPGPSVGCIAILGVSVVARTQQARPLACEAIGHLAKDGF